MITNHDQRVRVDDRTDNLPVPTDAASFRLHVSMVAPINQLQGRNEIGLRPCVGLPVREEGGDYRLVGGDCRGDKQQGEGCG